VPVDHVHVQTEPETAEVFDAGPGGRGLHSFTLELDLSNSRTYSRVNLGHMVDREAQVELKWERVYAPAWRLRH